MRFCLSLCLALAFCTSFAQPMPSTLKILGTIHQGNTHFNEKQLIHAIEAFRPDLILWEQPEGYKPVFGLGIASSLGVADPGIEQKALQKLLRKHKSQPIFGFDSSFDRKAFIRQLSQTTADIDAQLLQAWQQGKMNSAEAAAYRRATIIDSAFFAFVLDTTLERINQQDMIDVARERYAAEKKILLPLAKTYADTVSSRSFEDIIRFWDLRNAYMCTQIRKYVKQFPGKRILVLTGLDHKYYLVDCLANEESLRLTE